MKWIKIAVLAAALAACGGNKNKTETPPPDKTPDKVTKDTPPPPTKTVEPTCENAVAHGMDLMVKSGNLTQEKADERKAKSIASCKKDNPSKEMLVCILKATSPAGIGACDSLGKQDGGKDSDSTPKRKDSDSKSAP